MIIKEIIEIIEQEHKAHLVQQDHKAHQAQQEVNQVLKASPGVQGPQGERGLTGLTGPTGPASTVPGPQGEMGFNGTDGMNGTQGPPGIVNAELCPAGTDLENVYVLNGTTAESCDITPTSACEICFTTLLTAEQQQFVLDNAEQGDTFAEICEFLQENENNPEESEIVFGNIGLIPGITPDQQNNLFNCLVNAGVVDP